MSILRAKFPGLQQWWLLVPEAGVQLSNSTKAPRKPRATSSCWCKTQALGL